ncbi:uncharacterized protein METZ01_LOCUS269318 [marine metagenome]|uniref:Uncharacterized protein n=1 Tax=marine metagenome TaxID=408172 RepID=A0A382JVE7_9ZZZZ
MRTTPHVCGYCGKRSGKDTERLTLIEPQDNVTPYAGNLRVLRKTSHPSGYNNVWTDYTLWDGESYRNHQYGAFCTLRCASAFANACYRDGMRIVQRDSA